MKTISKISARWLIALLFAAAPAARAADTAPDLTKDHVVYMIGYSHLDTQWRWCYPQVISEFIPKTLAQNIPLFEKYPHYIFNWTGANRYRMLKEYYPQEYAVLKDWIAKGRWFTAGSSWEENDVNVPSSESLIRQILLGRNYFKKEFGTESDEYMLPDCFGFPASLPSVLAHCGLRGFSTQKLTWHSANGIPFDIGVWQGLDGQSVIAALNPGSYGAKYHVDLANYSPLVDRVDSHGSSYGVFADYLYYGTGDTGGAPDEETVAAVEQSVTDTNGPLHIVSARSDQMFRDITDAEKAKMPVYQGDLLLTEHSAGSISSEAYMKRWNHMNEILATEAESASVAASVIGATPYPREKLQHAWQLVLGGQFHDLLPGTALPKAFEYTWNDEIIAMNSFAGVLSDAVGGVARAMDTKVDGRPIIVFNPLSVEREDVVEAEMPRSTEPGFQFIEHPQVFDGAGRPVPTQASSPGRLLFLAKVPALGFAVFSVKSAADNASASTVKADEHSLENSRYRVKLNDAGDIFSIFDKTAKRELLFAPMRLAFQTERPAEWPAWNMEWKDRRNAPRGHVNGPATIKVLENGPVRAAIQVHREAENSIFDQTIRLAAGAAGDRVEIANHVDWQSKACSLKVEFPLTVTNLLATYNWEIGKIQRGNNDPKKFEVPSHQWFDLTDRSGDYGVSILTDYKYGSDKPADTLLRLTLLYTPAVTYLPGISGQPWFEQQWQDWGRHDFTYAVYGHPQDWRAGKSDWQSLRLSQPLLAFSTTAHDGKLGRSFSVLHLDSDQIAIRALKLGENSDQAIVRLQELNGTNAGSVTLATTAGLGNPAEVNGVETPLRPLPSSGSALKLDFTPYQIRSLALDLTAPAHLTAPVSTPVDLPYDLAAFTPPGTSSTGGFDDHGDTMPADMIGDTVVSEGITFKIGPRSAGAKNAVICRGQTINLPAGRHNRVYLLAAATGDTKGDFKVDGQAVTLGIQNWTGYIGQWDNRAFKGTVSELTPVVTNMLDHIDSGFIKRDPLGWFCSHRHLADGSDGIYQYSYLFKYHLDIGNDAKTLTLPDNPAIRVVAVSVAQNDNDSTVPVQPLYDDFTGRPPVTLRTEP
jgi:alpha-mannosidase